MGLRVTGVTALNIALQRGAVNSSRALRRLQEEAAQEILEVAREGAPLDTGNLESAITRATSYDLRSKVDQVVVSEEQAPYAIYMHEGEYSLGRGSQAKDGTGRIPVGNKFLTRAVDYVMNVRGYFQRAIDAVQRGLK